MAGIFLLGAASATRLLFVLYGQSNMDGFTTTSDGSPPAAAPNTSFYDGASIVAVPAANGIREFMNAVVAASGLPCIALSGAVPGASLSGLIKGTSAYTALMAQINAVILPTDRVFVLWDQGEGDANQSPHQLENIYKAEIAQLSSDLASDMSRTQANCPFIIASLGTCSITNAALDGGTTDISWQTVKNAHFNCSLEQPNTFFSHTNIDYVRFPADVYHYVGSGQAKQGKRFAQTINTMLGVSSGQAHWLISGGAVVDATHTNINVVHSLGTDFTPTSGGNGWEVSGNNGATWITATAARNSSTQIQLTHASISTTSTRKVRYQWGLMPPNASGSNPTTAPILDNSPLQIPLNYTTWDISPVPLSVVPVPTWRYATGLTGASLVQTTTAIPLGPSIGSQKFVIVSLSNPGVQPTSVTLTPKDAQGNASGSAVAMTFVKQQNTVQIYQGTLGSDANSAYAVDASVVYPTNPFGNTILQLWTVPLADMSSTTATGTGGASASSATADTATVNVSAGGFIIQSTHMNTSYSTAAVLSGTETYAQRYETGVGIPGYCADASNCSANAASSATGTFPVTGNIDMALAAWR